MSNPPPSDPARPPVRFLLAFLAATLVARLVLIFATGFCDDEAYVVTISRTPALSYFDHPPLHQWLLTAWVGLFGEGRAARLPFFACSLLTGLALFGLARRLFSTAAAWWTLFAFSASAYFLVYPDGYIMPDPPLLALLALAAWAVAEILYCESAGEAPDRHPRESGDPGATETSECPSIPAFVGMTGTAVWRNRDAWLWLAAGLALGLAGLAKYSAIFAPLGLLGFLLTSPRHRRWLIDPRPYLGAALGVLCLTPALIWNAEHGWASLAFQSGRAVRKFTFDMKALREILAGLGAQVAAMSPWIGLPLAAGLIHAFRAGAESPSRFLLWLAAPPLAFFALIPLLGERAISHWFNSGWLFAFPLAGAWLAERSPRFLSRFAAISASCAALAFALYLVAVLSGPIEVKGMRDPTRGMFDWPTTALRDAYARSGAKFVLIENWRLGGRVGVALGPSVPICAMGGDPRGFAFACDARAYLGQDALVIRAKDNGQGADEKQFFRNVEPLGETPVGRRGLRERNLTLEIGRDLQRVPPLPYGG